MKFKMKLHKYGYVLKYVFTSALDSLLFSCQLILGCIINLDYTYDRLQEASKYADKVVEKD